MIKLSDGFSGKGNAIIHLEDVQKVLHPVASYEKESTKIGNIKKDVLATRQAVATALRRMEYFSDSRDWDKFLKKMEEMGAIFELFLSLPKSARSTTTTMKTETAVVETSPSVQLVINAVGEVVLVSTHEQVLDGHVYKGCSFPANAEYRQQIQDYG